MRPQQTFLLGLTSKEMPTQMVNKLRTSEGVAVRESLKLKIMQLSPTVAHVLSREIMLFQMNSGGLQESREKFRAHLEVAGQGILHAEGEKPSD